MPAFVMLSNFIRHQVTEEKNKQKTIYNKHQNTIDMLSDWLKRMSLNNIKDLFVSSNKVSLCYN